MAKFPKSLAEAVAALKQFAIENGALNDRIETLQKEIENARRQARDAVAIRDNVHQQFDDLKERLHNSEIENARLRGYMERVREDDAVADPLVEIEGPDGKRFVSKRHPMPSGHGADPYLHEQMFSREKRKHWTSY